MSFTTTTNNNNTKQWFITPFLTGVITTIATYHLFLPSLFSKQKRTKSIKEDTISPSQLSSSSSSSPSSPSTTLMDSPTLDQRMLRKAEAALQNRTSRLIIVVERCTNDHNYSAILRTAEALGIHYVYIIDPQACKATLMDDDDDVVDDDGTTTTKEKEEEEKNSKNSKNTTRSNETEGKDLKLYRSTGQHVKHSTEAEVKDRAQHHLFAQKAVEWLEVKEFETTRECIDDLKSNGYQIWSTDLSQVAVCLTREALLQESSSSSSSSSSSTTTTNIIPDKLAIVFGTEAVGVTTEMLNASDKRVYLPLRGFADSLNLSVATALVIHQLFTLDPTLIGAMSDDERINIRRKWYAKLASQRLLTKSQKINKRRIEAEIIKWSKLEWRANNPNSSGYAPLHENQLDKVAKLPLLRAELKQIDDELKEKSLKIVEDLVMNPPQPLGDMRRADEHRTTYVGKNTKKNQGDVWNDMPATSYCRTEEFASASFFRDRLKK